MHKSVNTKAILFSLFLICLLATLAINTNAQDDKRAEAEKAMKAGSALFQQGTAESLNKAMVFITTAREIYRELNDKINEAVALLGLGRISSILDKNQTAIDYYNQALQLLRSVGDKEGEATILNNIGFVYESLNDKQKALESYQQAFRLFQEVGNKQGQATSLTGIGKIYSDLDEVQKALESYMQALPLFRAVQDKNGEASALSSIARCYVFMSERTKALEYLNQSLHLSRMIGDKDTEAYSLTGIGVLYSAIGEKQKALDSFTASLILYRTLKDKDGEMQALTGIGLVYSELGQYQKALEYYNNALSLTRIFGDKEGEATIINNIGLIYSNLGEYEKALEFFNQALPVFRKLNIKITEATTLNNIGNVYLHLGENQKALEFFNQALPLHSTVGNKRQEAITLNNIGLVYVSLEDKQKALNYLDQALSLARSINDKGTEALTLNNKGFVYNSLGEKEKAIENYYQAIPLFRAVGDIRGEAIITSNLTTLWKDRGSPRTAIFYGKQMVNAIQFLRSNIQSLDSNVQKNFLKAAEPAYRLLADILIEQGRIPEAEQVLAMLKEEEYFDYLRRDDKVANSLLKTATLTPDEADAVKRYDELADKVTTIGKEYGELYEESRKPLYEEKTFPKQARLDELKKRLDDATTAFTKFLEELKTTFKNDVRVKEIESGLQAMLKSMKVKRTAIVSTIVGEDRLNIIVTTPDAQRAHTVDIKAADVNKLVAEFRTAVTNPLVDPRDSGKRLYDIIIKPIEKDLAGIKTDTIVWSLDGTLRYVPVVALWDGESYLAQRYANVIITLASQKNLEKEISDKSAWRALGVGVSKEFEDFPALSAVPDELDCIITDAVTKAVSLNPKCQNGVVNGKKLIDDVFTKDAFKNAMGRYSLVHIASHFSLQPGDDKNSFLLLGGGAERKLSVSEINQSMFNGVELLTLSACNTAVGTEKSNGVEVEGFGAVAQNQGAKAVIATLWAVADPSTRDFMVKFYSLYDSNKNLNKAEALRQAQLSLLRSKDIAATNEQNRERSEKLYTKNDNANAQKPFTKDPKKPYAHPYYWAPFVLIGNWR